MTMEQPSQNSEPPSPPKRGLGTLVRTTGRAIGRGLGRDHFANTVSLAALIVSVAFPLWLNRPQRRLDALVAETTLVEASSPHDTLSASAIGVVIWYLNSGNRAEIVLDTHLVVGEADAAPSSASVRFIDRRPVLIRPGEVVRDTLRFPLPASVIGASGSRPRDWLGARVLRISYVVFDEPWGGHVIDGGSVSGADLVRGVTSAGDLVKLVP